MLVEDGWWRVSREKETDEGGCGTQCTPLVFTNIHTFYFIDISLHVKEVHVTTIKTKGC